MDNISARISSPQELWKHTAFPIVDSFHMEQFPFLFRNRSRGSIIIESLTENITMC